MKKTLAVLISLTLPILAVAAEPDGQGATQGEPGADTRFLMELQSSGRAASPTDRPMSGEVARRTNQRYVESFSQPIPKSLSEEEQAFVKGKN